MFIFLFCDGVNGTPTFEKMAIGNSLLQLIATDWNKGVAKKDFGEFWDFGGFHWFRHILKNLQQISGFYNNESIYLRGINPDTPPTHKYAHGLKRLWNWSSNHDIMISGVRRKGDDLMHGKPFQRIKKCLRSTMSNIGVNISRFDMSGAQAHWVESNRSPELCH